MSTDQQENRDGETLFTSAGWYECSINWNARLSREIPVLVDVFGPPGKGGILDAGCGTGHQACALADRGYRVVAADASEQMLEIARDRTAKDTKNVKFIHTPYATLHEKAGGGFDGLWCIGNSLAASGTRPDAREGLSQFAQCLRPGGRLFVQILNFPIMRLNTPCVRGPRITNVDGMEYVSVRHFVFRDDCVEVNNITVFKDDSWQLQAHTGRLYPITPEEMFAWCQESDLQIDELWGSYNREPFDVNRSVDLIVVASRGQ